MSQTKNLNKSLGIRAQMKARPCNCRIEVTEVVIRQNNPQIRQNELSQNRNINNDLLIGNWNVQTM